MGRLPCCVSTYCTRSHSAFRYAATRNRTLTRIGDTYSLHGHTPASVRNRLPLSWLVRQAAHRSPRRSRSQGGTFSHKTLIRKDLRADGIRSPSANRVSDPQNVRLFMRLTFLPKYNFHGPPERTAYRTGLPCTRQHRPPKDPTKAVKQKHAICGADASLHKLLKTIDLRLKNLIWSYENCPLAGFRKLN
jgi:hypothetical protein